MSLSAVVRSIIPKLTGEIRKGQCGRVGVIGGSVEYTGAPYYSLMASLRTGADIGHIFCEIQAATPIKSYSPELIVHPVLISADDLEDALSFEEKAIQCAASIERWFPSLHSLSIGSGLGRDRLVIDSTMELIRRARSANKPIILDGDALFALREGENMQVIQGYKRCILTPNYRELMGLINCSNEVEGAEKLARNLGNVTIVLKGETDVITNGVETLLCNQTGSPRRCGGQGDILAGAINTFVAWSVNSHNSVDSDLPLIDACHAACQLVRHASQAAFQKSKRATTAVEILDHIGPSFYELFDRFLDQDS